MQKTIYSPFISRPLGGYGASSGFAPRASVEELQQITALGGRPREDLSPSQARLAVRALLSRRQDRPNVAATHAA